MEKDSAIIIQYGKTKCIPIDNCKNIDNGMCIVVPVTLHRVCAQSNALVIVEVYMNCKLYCRKIKKIYTGNLTNHQCECYEELIKDLFVDNFKFYFINQCNPKDIKVTVDIQYLCEE